ncbi:MAG: nuclear transport factor 2 family protein [Halothiobacillaceae bacterium]
MNIQAATERYSDLFSQLTPNDLQRFDEYFAANARFSDPFNEVQGVDAIRKVFAHMYKQCAAPRFVVHNYAISGQIAYLHWRFDCDKNLSIDGLSKVVFDELGMVQEHIDYWDAAAQVYARIPVLGSILRFIQGRLEA